MAQIVHIPRAGSVASTSVRVTTQSMTFSDQTIGLEFVAPEDGCYRLVVDDLEAQRLIATLNSVLLAKAERIAAR